MSKSIPHFKLKHRNADFCVKEVPLAIVYEEGPYHVYLLRKSNLTTHEAVGHLAEHANIESKAIDFSGLKDEDAVTEQYISVPQAIDVHDFNTKMNKKGLELSLVYCGTTKRPFSIGKLLGNAFKLAVRGLSSEMAELLRDVSWYHDVYVNYYGTQRFGLPNKKKTTHQLGLFLLEKNYQKAYDLIVEQKPEDAFIQRFSRNPEEYFECIDKRQLMFYYSSYYSSLWNEELIRLIAACESNSYSFEHEGMPFIYPLKRETKLSLLKDHSKIDLIKYRLNDGEPHKIHTFRSSVVAADVYVEEVQTDPDFDGLYKADINFFIPTGCYATVIVPQFLHSVTHELA